MTKRCIIVGASHAGSQLAVQLRKQGWEGEILVIGEESNLPYHRPPLSKGFLSDQMSLNNMLIRSAESYARADIEFKLGARVVDISAEDKKLLLATGEELVYEKLALTTGVKVRKIPLPGADKKGVNYLRTMEDVNEIKQSVKPGGNAVIIGGGYIGLETAAQLRQMDMHVTVLEALPRVLQRVTAPEVSEFYVRVHREQGVDILTNKIVESIAGGDRVASVVCQDGKEYPADLVVIGVGVVPEVSLAEKAGLAVENGIVVDQYATTSDANIVAAGDCANFYHPLYKRQMRLESVQNATDQAKVAAETLCDKLKPYSALPWFWSDQYDVKLQIAGLSQDYDQVVIRGDVNQGRSFAAFYLKDGALLAVDAVNRPKEFLISKMLISGQHKVDPCILGDENADLKALIKK